MTDVDYKARYRTLRHKHEELKAAVRFWIRSDFYHRYMREGPVSLFPQGERFDKVTNANLRASAEGQRLLNALDCPIGMPPEPLEGANKE